MTGNPQVPMSDDVIEEEETARVMLDGSMDLFKARIAMPDDWQPPGGWEEVPRKMWPIAYVALTSAPKSAVQREAIAKLRRWKREKDEKNRMRREKRRRKAAATSRKKNRRRK